MDHSTPRLMPAIACALALLPAPVLAQQTTTVTGTQTTAYGQNARLECAEVRLPRQGSITAATTRGTNGFWINRGSVRDAYFPSAGQAVGHVLRANDTYYICPDAASGSGTSSVQVTIRY